MNLPLLTACREAMLSWRASQLTTKYNVGPTNPSAKPPFEGVSMAWRLDHATSPINTHKQGRARALPLKRIAQRRTTKRLAHMAQLSVMTHKPNRTHDGQESGLQKPFPATNQSGQETPMNDNIKDIEIALRDGMIDELTETTETSIDVIRRLMALVESQEESIARWECLTKGLLTQTAEIANERDRARDLAIRLEAECHGCMDTEHHSNKGQY